MTLNINDSVQFVSPLRPALRSGRRARAARAGARRGVSSEYLEELHRDGREVIARKQAALLRDIDAGLSDLEAGRVYDGEKVFSKLLGEEQQRQAWCGFPEVDPVERTTGRPG